MFDDPRDDPRYWDDREEPDPPMSEEELEREAFEDVLDEREFAEHGYQRY